MRFRLANSGQGSSGISNAVSNLFALPMLRAQAAEEAEMAGVQRRRAEAQIAHQMAQAAVEEEKRRHLAGRGDTFDTLISSRAGVDVPTLNRWRDAQRTGMQPMTGSATGFPEMDELIGIKPQPAIDPAVATRLATEFSRVAPALVNPDDYTVQGQADASGKYQTQDVLDQVLRGQMDPGRAGSAVAASKGTAQFNNIGNTGAGFNVHTGEGQVLDAALRTLFQNEGQALIGQRNAAAGASGASANLSNARRDRVVGGYDKPVTILDDDTGEANITRIPTGQQPVTVGVAPKKGTGVDATNAKERNRVTTAVEKEMVGASDAEIAAEVERRMARRAAPGKTPAAAPAAPKIDMTAAAKVRADFKAGKLTREQAASQLRALGFK
jgi:hypothetical protein